MKKYLLFLIVLIPFFSLSQSTGKFVLLEEFSTAPCGFCPDGDVIADGLIKAHPNIIWVTHHAGFGTDSMTLPESVTIANAFTTFAPGAAIDRGDYQIPVYTIAPYIAVSRQKWDSVTSSHFSDPAKVYVGITNNFNATTRMLNCTVDATFLTAPVSGDMRINIYLVEDSIVGNGTGYDQKNYLNTQVGHPCYQKGDPYIGYVHHHVIRKVLTGAWGVGSIIPNTPVVGTKYSKAYTNILLPANWKTKDMDVVAFVSYNNSNAALRPVINSNHKKLLDASASGVNAFSIASNISIYPNPSSKNIFVEGDLKSYQNCVLQLMNITGQLIQTIPLEKNNPEGISIQNLNNGIYFYRIIADGAQVSAGKLNIIR